MAEIISLQEDWDNHNGDEVEAYLKGVIASLQSQVQGKYGRVEVDGTNISFYEDENSNTPLKTITLSGTVYRVEVTASENATFNVLSSDTSKSLTFSAESFSAPFGNSNWSATGEDFTYIVSVDNGTGQFVQKKTESLRANNSVTLNIRGWLTTGQNRLKIVVIGNESGQQATKIFTINVTSLFLESSFAWQKPWIENEAFMLDGIRFSGNLQKTLYIAIDDEVVETISFPSGTNYTSSPWSRNLEEHFPEDMESSGIHTIEVWMEGGGVSTQSYKYNVMCVLESEKLTAQLIAINNLKSKASNFVSEVLFQFAVYNVSSVTFATTVTDGETPSTSSRTISSLQTRTKNDYNSLIEYVTSATEGITLTIEATAGTATAEVELPVDNSTAFLPASEGMTFYMNAATRSNGSNDRAYINNQAPGAQVENYLGVWSGFSFGDNDGWTTDGDGANAQRALVAKAGCHIEFSGVDGQTVVTPPIAPLGGQVETGSATIELKFKSENVADYDTPVLSIADEDQSHNPIGIFLYPTKLVVLAQLHRDTIYQTIGLEEGEIHHITIVFQKGYEGVTGKNLCYIYMNGICNTIFSYDGKASFGDGNLKIGQDSTDFNLYMMRFYNRALESGEVLANFINTIVDGDEFTRAGVRDDNDIIDKENVDYEMAKKAGFNIMVVETNVTLPYFGDKEKGKTCTLHMWYGSDNDSRNFSITNCALSGQGTTSMNYYRWNLRFKAQDNSLWTYSDYSTSTGKKGWFDGKNNHSKVADIVAKKNYASAMQGHKMGAVAFYNDLYMKVVGAPSVGARVAVYQYPVLGFQKFNDEHYEFIGLYTIGPHKGDKGTFGYDGTAYPSLLSLEGPNHDPLGTRFLHAWQNVDYDQGKETLTFGGEEGWDCDYCPYETGYDNELSVAENAQNKAAVLALYEQEWKPAYEQVFFCSPYLASLADMPEEYNAIAKINADVTNFRKITVNGLKADLLQIYDPNNNYKLYSYNNYTGNYVEVTTFPKAHPNSQAAAEDMLDYLDGYLDGSASGLPPTYVAASDAAAPTRAELINARKWKFWKESEYYWAVNSVLFHYCFCVLIGATDNFAKNMYPFKFKTLEQGGTWCFRQDDLDSILSTDNNGTLTKKYSVMPGDVTGDSVPIYQGSDSALWKLVENAFAKEINETMGQIVNAAAEIATEHGIPGNFRHETLFNVFEFYFWSNSAKYFPAEAYNKDTRFSYITPWYIDPTQDYNNVFPLRQVRGDAQYSEREWVKKHIAFIFSRYMIGGFAASDNDYGYLTLTLISDFTFNVKPAIDLYPVLNLGGGGGGGGTNVQGARTTAGQTCPVSISSSGQTIVNVFGANWLSELGDLKELLITNRSGDTSAGASLSIKGKRLRKLKIGDADKSSIKFNAVGLLVSDAPALEEFDARNVTSLTSAVNLSACKRLRKVLFGGSTCPGVILPEGAQLEQVTFPDSLDTLFLKSLPTLTTDSLLVNNATKMSDVTKHSIRGLYVQNCPNINPITLISELWFTGGYLQYFTLLWDDVTCTKDDFKALYNIAQGLALDLGSDSSDSSSSSSDIASSDSSSSGEDGIRTKAREYGGIAFENGETTQVAGTPTIEGNVFVDDFIDADEWEMLHTTWPNLNITARGRIINFEDQNVKDICVAQWGGPVGAGGVAGVAGELTMEQAAKVSSIGTNQGVFYNNRTIVFVDFTLFTGLKTLSRYGQYGAFSYCTALQEVILPPNMEAAVDSLFSYCSSLIKVIFPNGFKSLNQRMFYKARNGIVLDLPSSLNTITGVFANSNDSTLILILRGNVGTFDGLKSATRITKIYVPDQYLSDYQTYLSGSSNLSKLYPLSEYEG